MTFSASLSRYRTTLRSRDFRRMLSAFTIMELGAWSYTIVLAVYVYGQTGSVTSIGLVASVRWIVGMLVTSFAGVAVDRYERRRLLTVCSFIVGGVMVVMTVAVANGASLWVILLLSGINALFESPNRSAAGALLPEVVDESDLVTANVMVNLLENFVIIGGPLLGGLLILLGDPALAVGINAASYFTAGLIYSRVSVRSVGDVEEASESVLTQWRSGLRDLAHRPYAIALTLCLMVSCGLDSGYMVVFAELTGSLALGESGYSYFFAASAVGGVLIAVVANQLAELPKLGLVIAGCLVLQGVPLAMIGLSGSLSMVLVLLVLAGAGTVVLDVIAITALQRTIPNRLLGRTLSTVVTLQLLAATSSVNILGRLVESIGLDRTILVSGLTAPALALLLLPVLLRGDTTASQDAMGVPATVAFIENLDLFDGLNRTGIESLAQSAVPMTLPVGYALMHEGEPADDLWLLRSGTLAVSIEGMTEPVPDVAAPGWVGELGLLHGWSRSATVTTLEECQVLRINGTQFRDAIAISSPSPSLLQLAATRATRMRTSGKRPTSPMAFAAVE